MQVFIVLLGFSESLASVAKVAGQTKCVSLNDEPCLITPTLIDLNLAELKYQAFAISLDKCNESRNVLSPKICFRKSKR